MIGGAIFKSNASLRGTPSSQADHWQDNFHFPRGVHTSGEQIWSWQGTFLCPAVICCCQGAKEEKTSQIDARRVANNAFWLALSGAEKDEFTTVLADGDGVFHIAKQMGRTNQDDVDENCVCDNAGELPFTDEDTEGWGTTDVIVVRQLQEKYIAANKLL